MGYTEKKRFGEGFFLKDKRVFCKRSNEVIQCYSFKRTCLSANLNLKKACYTPRVQAHSLTSHQNMKNSIIHSAGCISSAVVHTVALAQQFAPLNAKALLVLMTAMEVLAMLNIKQVGKCFAGAGQGCCSMFCQEMIL